MFKEKVYSKQKIVALHRKDWRRGGRKILRGEEFHSQPKANLSSAMMMGKRRIFKKERYFSACKPYIFFIQRKKIN